MLTRFQDNSIPKVSALSDSVEAVLPNTMVSGTTEEHLGELAQAVVEFKLVSLANSENYEQLIQKLRTRTRWLITGWLFSVLVLGGIGVAATYSLHTAYTQQQKSIEAILATPGIESGKIEQLETQIEKLNDQLWVHNEKLKQLQTQAKTATETTQQQQQSLEDLNRTLKDLLAKPSVNPPLPSSGRTGERSQ